MPVAGPRGPGDERAEQRDPGQQRDERAGVADPAVLGEVREAEQDSGERRPEQDEPGNVQAGPPRAGPGSGGAGGSSRQASTRPTAITGTLTKNSQRQLSQLRITPPITGPRIGPSASGRLTVAIRLGLARPPAAFTPRVWIKGKISPAAKPCSTRKPIRLVSLQDRAHRTEPSTKSTSAAIQTRLPPHRLSAHPVIGIATAIASR